MNDFQRAELKVLFAMLIEYHERPSSLRDLEDLNLEYSIRIPDEWLHSTVSKWERRDMLTVSRTMDGSTAVVIRRAEYGQALTEILDWLGASSLSIYTEKREIVSDVSPPNDIPLKDGWKWLIIRNSESSEKSVKIDSAEWTGRYAVSPEGLSHIKLIVRQIDERVDTSELSNVDKTNAKALLEAAEKLIDAPDPQWNLIVQILSSPILANFAAIAAIAISIIKS